MRNQSIPLDRARRVVLETSIRTFETGLWTNRRCNYSNRVPEFQQEKTVFWDFWNHILGYIKPDRTIGQSSSSCNWSYNGTLGTRFWTNQWSNYSNRVLISLTSESISILCIFIFNFYLYYKRLHLYYSYIYISKKTSSDHKLYFR